VATLRGKITLNTKAFKAGVKRVKTMAKMLGAQIVDRFKQVGKNIAVGLLAATAVSGFVVGKFAKQILDSGDQLHKMALRTGFTTEELSRLKHAAELSGTSIEGIEDTVKDMQKNLVDAASGSASMREQFSLLNLNVEELMKLSPAEQFRIISKALTDVEHPSQRAAIAMRIFGEGGRRLVPLLANGSEGLKQMKKDADRLGITLGGKQANNIAAFNDSVSRLGKSFLGLFQKALGFEDLRLLVDRITESVINFRESTFFEKTVANIGNLLSGALAMGNGILNVLTKTDSNFWKFAGRIGVAAIAAGVAFKSGLMLPIIKGLAVLYTAITAISIGEAIEESFDLSTRFARIQEKLSSGFDNVMTLIAGKMEGLSDEEIGEMILERDAQRDAVLDNLSPQNKDFLETLKKKMGENNDAFKQTIGEILGTDDLDGTVSDIISKYKDGVKDFENISLENKNNQIDLGADKQSKEFGLLKKKIQDVRKEAGKQVRFFVDLDKFRHDKSFGSGGITSKSIRQAGQKAREQISLDGFKAGFQKVGDKFRQDFLKVLNPRETDLQTSTQRQARQPLALGNQDRGIAPIRRENIVQNVESKATQLGELISLTKAANETRNNMLTALNSLKGGFGSV